MPVVWRSMTVRAPTRHLVVAEDPHEVGRRRRLGRERDVALVVVELELEVGQLDVAEVPCRSWRRSRPGDLLGVVVERLAAGGEAGGVERLAHAGLQQVAERGVDGEADGADHRDQRDGEEDRRDAAAVARTGATSAADGRA